MVVYSIQYDEKCPNCGDENYDVEDFDEVFDDEGGTKWWTCVCNKCQTKFEIRHIYTLNKIEIEKVENSEEQ